MPSSSIGTDSRVQGLYDAALMLTAIALPFSNFLMSQGAFLLVIAWGFDRWKNGALFRGRSWAYWQAQPVLWAVLALYAWELLSQCWSTDWAYGWRALRIQLPLLAFPLILTTARWDQRLGLQRVQGALAVAVIAACATCLWMGMQKSGELQPRDWSPFISHIRFNLIITFAWGWWLIRWFQKREPIALLVVLLITIVGGWFTWKSASLTGAMLFPMTLLVASWHFERLRQGVLVVCALGIGAAGVVGWNIRPVYPEATDLEVTSPRGEAYVNHPDRCLRENGTHIWVHIAWNELFEAWSKRSSMDFHGQDERNQELKMTLIRFLASKGLKKDADGVHALNDQEVRWIEQGIPTVLEKTHRGLRRRLDVIQFEVWNARDGGNPSGHSLVQRFAFLDAARHIYQQHPVLGVGIGDLPMSYAEAYDALNSPLVSAFRLRAHNQYVTFLVAGGPLNLILWLVLLGAIVPFRSRIPDYPTEAAALFLVIIALSCLTEDTLETQAGVTFAGFFIGLFGRRYSPKI
jgi:hypothetical protein